MSDSHGMTIERLKAFDAAWASRDIEALMNFVTEDCEYHASVGPEPGERFIGKDEVRRGFQAMLDHDASSDSMPGNVYVYGDRGVAEWSYRSIDEAGNSTIARGCDLFQFVGDKISLKNAFRKCPT
jgi:ketosteroid isomerase-like protein